MRCGHRARLRLHPSLSLSLASPEWTTDSRTRKNVRQWNRGAITPRLIGSATASGVIELRTGIFGRKAFLVADASPSRLRWHAREDQEVREEEEEEEEAKSKGSDPSEWKKRLRAEVGWPPRRRGFSMLATGSRDETGGNGRISPARTDEASPYR